MKIPNIFVPNKDLEKNIESLLEEPVNVQLKYNKFEVIRADTYAEGIAKLKERGQKPFTFYENIEARIVDHEINGKDAELFDTWLDSVTGIAYKAKSTKFKLILRSEKLENIKQDIMQRFSQNFIPIDFIPINYNIEQGIELDSKKGKYDQPLTREEVKNHEFWFVAMNGDKERLVEYVDLWFDKTGEEKGMGVYLESNTSQDELLAVSIDIGNNKSGISNCYFHYYTCLISGAQQK